MRAAIECYFRAQATGLGEHHRKVFHPEAKLFFNRDGKFSQLTSEEYIARAPGVILLVGAEDELGPLLAVNPDQRQHIARAIA